MHRRRVELEPSGTRRLLGPKASKSQDSNGSYSSQATLPKSRSLPERVTRGIAPILRARGPGYARPGVGWSSVWAPFGSLVGFGDPTFRPALRGLAHQIDLERNQKGRFRPDTNNLDRTEDVIEPCKSYL